MLFYDQQVWCFKTPGGDKNPIKLHIFFIGSCSLLAMAFNDKDESTTKNIASLQAVTQKAGYKGVTDMIIENLYSKLLPK